MIRETYKGRKIVITRNKGYGGGWTIKINGIECATGTRSESDELTWVKGTIDAVDAAPKGESRYGAVWYAPGTFEINENGHVVEIGGVCSCSYCAPVAVTEPTPVEVDNAAYDSVKVGFVDADGNYTGEHTRVPRSAASVVESAPAPVSSGNVTITLPAEYARKALEQLREARKDDAVRDATTAVHVLVRRLEDALAAVAVVDVTDPGESREEWKTRTHGEHYGMGVAALTESMSIVTVVGDLVPTARYALWVCDLEGRHGCGVKCSGHHMAATGTGSEIAGTMALYAHRYAERLDS